MIVLVAPDISGSKYLAVTAASAPFGAGTMVPGKVYKLTVSVSCLIKQGAHTSSPVASAANGSMLVNVGDEVYLHGSYGDDLAVMAVTGTGHATLTPVEPAR